MEFKPFKGDTDLRSPRKKMATGDKKRLGEHSPKELKEHDGKCYEPMSDKKDY